MRSKERVKWQEFHNKHPEIWRAILMWFSELNDRKQEGRRHPIGKISIGAIIDYRIRMWHGYKVPNYCKKYYRELFIKTFPEHKEKIK